MTITDVRVRLINRQDNNHKAICSFTIDNCFVVHDLRIIQGDNGLFVGMPRRLTKSGEWKDVAHCLDNQTRELLFNKVIDAYNNELSKAKNGNVSQKNDDTTATIE